jgi:hypothetical protein
MGADEAVAYVMDNDISNLLGEAEVVRERRPATMVNTVLVSSVAQIVLEAAAAARQIDVPGLIRQIIEEWIEGNGENARR